MEVQVLIEPVPPELMTLITGRDKSIFAADVERDRKVLEAECAASRILVIGASGSIGSAAVKLIALLKPAALVLVDLNENTLADLVRVLRSGRCALPEDFSTSVVALGTPAFTRFLAASGPFQVIFNFAALKHVRSERDPFSLMRMITTNALAVEDLAHEASRWGSRLFSVSTDKAVFPTSLMGATKRWMERVLAEPSNAICTSARFANVAFSDGSLLNEILGSFKPTPASGRPDNVRRYFCPILKLRNRVCSPASLRRWRNIRAQARSRAGICFVSTRPLAESLAQRGFEAEPAQSEKGGQDQLSAHRETPDAGLNFLLPTRPARIIP
jgi:hypothetical protein